MNNLNIPPSPNWYESRILACAVDNTIIYGSKTEIVVIKPRPYDEPADIKVVPHAHYERLLSLDVNPNWEPGNMLCVSAGDDKIVKLWNIEDCSCKGANNSHTAISDRLVGAVFAGNDKVVSVSENGFVTIWRILANDKTPIKNLFMFKVQITAVSACPHSPWLVAFGLKCGLVVVTDLRKGGRVLYKMRGHDKSIVSLSWCPSPFNIFPRVTIKRIDKNGEDDNVSIDNNGALNENVDIERSVGDDSKLSNTDTIGNVRDKIEECCITEENQKVGTGEETEIKLVEVHSNMNAEMKSEDVQLNTNTEIKSDDAQLDTNTDIKSEDVQLDTRTEIKSDDVELGTNEKMKLEVVQLDTNITEMKSDKLKADTNTDTKSEDDTNAGIKSDMHLDTNTEMKLEDVDSDINVAIKTDADTVIAKTLRKTMDEGGDVGSNIKDESTSQLVKEYLLASSSKGSSICIWRASTDGRKQTELFVSQRNKKNYRGADRNWVALLWITPHILLSSSLSGELLQWDFSLNKDANPPRKKLVHHDHGSNLFVIAAPMRFSSNSADDSWRNKKELFAWTIGQERLLLCTSIGADRTTFVSYPTNGGFIYCLTSSPLDPNRLAVGIGDNTVKIWDLSRPHLQCIIMANSWQRIQSKVLTLAWHPAKENLLAYGTFEGRIGLINSNNTSKNPSLLMQHFRVAVYRIVWGPLNGNVDRIGLYACGEGQIAIYDTEKPMEEPKILQIGHKEYATCMSWKSDYSVFGVGTKMGSIVIYDLNLEIIRTIYAQHKSIACLLWHPEATAEDTETSPYSSWLAVSTADASILVYDFSKEKGSGDDNKEDYRLLHVLNGHSKPVKSLCWSPYHGAKLVSGGEDGIAQVWDVQNKSIISTYTGHNVEAILTVLWSPLDQNFVITGGKDNCIRIWNITENKPVTEDELVKVWKERLKLKQDVKKHKHVEESDDEEIVKVNRGMMLRLTAAGQNNVAVALEDCKCMFAFANKKSLEDPIRKCSNVTKLFDDKNCVLELLGDEQRNHVQKRQYEYNQQISLWKGDFAETLKDAIKHGSVNPWLISMAPMVSPKLWQEACEIYANKLLESNTADPIEVVSYLLACHKVEEAINVLCNGTLFREALALAKCRLSKSDPTINDILAKWATFSVVHGSYEMAAQCFIALGQYDEAAKALFKRSNKETLEFALELAEKSGNEDLKKAIMFRYNIFKDHADDQKDVDPSLDISQGLSSVANTLQTADVSNMTDQNVTVESTVSDEIGNNGNVSEECKGCSEE